jgi:predicted transcriptional regulator
MTTTMGVKLDEETRNRLKSLSTAKQRSAHWLMREAIREYLDK